MSYPSTLCGFRPTGRLHLGHYFSVIRPALDFQAKILIADFHAPSILPVENSTQANVEFEALLDSIEEQLSRFHVPYLNIINQSAIFEPERYFKLLDIAKVGELERMTQYKAANQRGENDPKRTAHLLTYPVLMAHDVAGYDRVAVGEDQKQHLEYARDLLQRYNKIYGGAPLKIPEPLIVGGRVMDLRDPTSKMSKSSPKGCIFLDDTPEEIHTKIRAAVMDDTGRKNLEKLFLNFRGMELVAKKATNLELKILLADAIIKELHGSKTA